MIDLVKKYDRSIAVILTSLAVLTTVYFSIQKNFDQLVRTTSIIKELQEVNAIQKEINRITEKSLEKIDQKLDRILELKYK